MGGRTRTEPQGLEALNSRTRDATARKRVWPQTQENENDLIQTLGCLLPETQTEGVLRTTRLGVQVILIETNDKLLCFEAEAVV